MAAVKLRTARMRLIVKELVLLFLTVVQARWYTGYGGYGDHGVYGGQGGYGGQGVYGGQGGYGGYGGYYFQNLDHNGPSNPFGSSSAGLALNPHYAYSRAAYQDYKYQQVKYTPYRSAPDFDFGHDENKGKHYCPKDRPFFIRRDTLRGARGVCVANDFCRDTAYNPREEACWPEIDQFFNFVTFKCELCPSVPGLSFLAFNYITQKCCPASNFNHFTEKCCSTDTPVYDLESEVCVALD